MFWMGLESLFGAEDKSWKITRRLCNRISFFLADSADTQRKLFDKVEACYNRRSEIIHGRWEDDPTIDQAMADTEAITRTVVRHLLEKPGMLETFISSDRNRFLEKLVLSGPLGFSVSRDQHESAGQTDFTGIFTEPPPREPS
jgi:hypothetical protein